MSAKRKSIRETKKIDSDSEIKTVHTSFSYIVIAFAIAVEFYVALRYINSDVEFDRRFALISLMEAIFALGSLFTIDLIRYKVFRLKPKKFRPAKVTTVFVFIVTFSGLVIIQQILQFIPLTIRQYDKALAIVFAGPAEEAFFRGLLLSVFTAIQIEGVSTGIKLPNGRRITAFQVLGVFFTSIAFMAIHVNYYGRLNILISVFFSGLLFGFVYIISDDLTGIILAHFLLNFINAFQTIARVGL